MTPRSLRANSPWKPDASAREPLAVAFKVHPDADIFASRSLAHASGFPNRVRSSRRPGYTLLEMILALAIALVILGAVYEFLNRQLTLAETGREIVEEASLARVLLDRMAGDILSSLGGVDPQQLPDFSSDEVEALLQAETFTPLFNTGVEGSANVLILSASRPPRELLAAHKRRSGEAVQGVSDLRRISYWHVGDGDQSGLAREELTAITSDGYQAKPPDVADPQSHIVAREVAGVTFEFFDGVAWQPTWNGSSYAPDGQTPLGPPAAIRITLSLLGRRGTTPRDYRRTVALPAGNNFPAQQIGF